MNTLKNQVQLIGNLGQDPEILNLESGKKLAKFSLATNESYKDRSGQQVENTQWHNCVAWGKTAELIEKLAIKGKEMMLRGSLSHRTYETDQGEKRYMTEVNIREFLILNR